MWSIQDPRDPWAWRNTWTGEIRNSYDDLWIVVPIIVLITLIALVFLVPILVHRYCPHCFPGRSWCRWFESLLFVLGQISREKEEKRIERKRSARARSRTSSAPSFIGHVEYGIPPSMPVKIEPPPIYQSHGESVFPSTYREYERSKRQDFYPKKRSRTSRSKEKRNPRSRRRKASSIPPLRLFSASSASPSL